MSQSVAEIIEGKVFDKLKEKGDQLSGIIVLDIEGPDGGKWTLDCDNVKVEKQDCEAPKVRIKMVDEDFKNMMNGELDPIKATFTGKLKIEGDMALATKLAMAIK